MKKIVLIYALLAFSISESKAQSFNNEGQVVSFMEGKEFKNSGNGLVIEYGYISSLNTYGIKVKNKRGDKFHFINVKIDCYGSFADLYGMSTKNGSNFGFRLYRNKLIVGKGEPGESTYYLSR